MEILKSKTDKGLIRENNEDACAIIKHPKNRNIKLLVLCDGMGGKDDGDIASSYVTSRLSNWFLRRSVREINKTEEITNRLKKYIKRLNYNLINKYGINHLGTTLTLALINRYCTIIINCGDSRCYIYKDKKLIQITSDDSDVWYYYKYGEVSKDDLRYFVNNNLINACIGIAPSLCKLSVNTIENDYDMLFLFSDGVTDMITDKKILEVIESEDNEDIIDRIVDEAVNVDQHLSVPKSLIKKDLTKYVVPFNGRDNATGIIYVKEE